MGWHWVNLVQEAREKHCDAARSLGFMSCTCAFASLTRFTVILSLVDVVGWSCLGCVCVAVFVFMFGTPLNQGAAQDVAGHPQRGDGCCGHHIERFVGDADHAPHGGSRGSVHPSGHPCPGTPGDHRFVATDQGPLREFLRIGLHCCLGQPCVVHSGSALLWSHVHTPICATATTQGHDPHQQRLDQPKETPLLLSVTQSHVFQPEKRDRLYLAPCVLVGPERVHSQ